jgi:uncharacterized SAM-dependent methyltransferase
MEETERAAFLHDALAGLSHGSKTLPGKYLWDEIGSDLFDQICAHPDYYPTEREMTLFPIACAELDAPRAYIALDICGSYLDAAIGRLAPDYPAVTMTPVSADYSKPIRLPAGLAGDNVLGFFAGTSIGNFSPEEAGAFLHRARDTLGTSRFLVGADPTRDSDRLKRAYGACGGLMPALHLNLLTRLNRELGSDFDLANFVHEARVVEDPFRVEAHLVAREAATYRLGGRDILFEAGESIRTDTSHKYAPDAFQALARSSGWTPERLWLDPQGGFSLHLLRG